MEKLIKKITDRIAGERFIIAVDGRCAAGKSTFAKRLADSLDAPVIHADDFFLPKDKRTPERLAEAGGNMDRERLLDDVLLPLRKTGKCTFRRYDCGIGDLAEEIVIPESRVYIVEGSYSCHPELWEYYGLHVFLTVSADEQMRRIILREGTEKAEMFRARWIPMEEKYFAKFGIAEKCEYVCDTTNQTK